MRAPRQPRKIHRESPANIPLVKHMFEDPGTQFVERALDAKWWYSTYVPSSLAGFNPILGLVLVAKESAIASWLRTNPWGPSRKYNLDDSLIKEVVFATHDYIHGWAVRAIRAFVPGLGYGTAPITKKSAENFVFCHILTEACATVGLDYWYLSTLDLNDICDIGTHDHRHGFTVSFREAHLEEYRRFNPSLAVQDVKFFDFIARFYCTGELYGFTPAALKESMVTRNWLSHELRYGQKQRIYIREWLSVLSGGRVSYTEKELRAPLLVDSRWKVKLIHELGALLWEKVKDDRPHNSFERISPEEAWRSPRRVQQPGEELDFRYINLNARLASGAFDLKDIRIRQDSFPFFAWQWASRYRFEEFPKEAQRLLSFVIERRDPTPLEFLFRGMKPIPPAQGEPAEIFLSP